MTYLQQIDFHNVWSFAGWPLQSGGEGAVVFARSAFRPTRQFTTPIKRSGSRRGHSQNLDISQLDLLSFCEVRKEGLRFRSTRRHSVAPTAIVLRTKEADLVQDLV
ncbi:hypothetical protein BaRGS_00000272, partial [Batillaria attramentaria]